MKKAGTCGYIRSGQKTLFGHEDVVGFGTEQYNVRMIDRGIANDIIRKKHYSHNFYSASTIHLGVFYMENLYGVLQFGCAMNPASQESVVEDTAQDEYLELNRMWLDDKLPRNSESMAISYAIKYIKRAHPWVKWIQSFADERCGRFGVMYQASNFLYLGEHTTTFWEFRGKLYHNSLMTRNPALRKSAAFIQSHRYEARRMDLRQFRYIFFIKRGMIKKLRLNILPYPKHVMSRIMTQRNEGGDSNVGIKGEIT